MTGCRIKLRSRHLILTIRALSVPVQELSSLRGHSLSFFTADNFAAWSYRSESGELIDEWEWFKLLRSELGLDIKYTVKQHSASTQAALQAMNAGKACDIIYSNHVVFPSALCISRNITDLISINNLGSSPGVCKMTMDLCKWGKYSAACISHRLRRRAVV